MSEAPIVTSFAINPEGLPNITVEGCSRFVREDEFAAYRAWVATALAEAEARGRRQGLEEAAGLGVSLNAIRRLFNDLAYHHAVDGEAKELFRSAAYALGDYRDEAEAIMADAPGRWIAWEETELDSDPSDIDCGYSTCWMVGWSHRGARDEDHIIRADTEAEARLLAANLNRLLTRLSATTPAETQKPETGESHHG